MKCKLCGKEFKDKRSMHGHLVRVHPEEYAAADHQQEQLTEGGSYPQDNKKTKPLKNSDKPDGFRLLNKKDADELAAYNEGYRYIDSEDIVYDAAEAKAEGWV